MGWKVINSTNFYFNFYEKREVHKIYNSIHFKDTSNPIYSNTDNDVLKEDIGTMVVELFPSYFTSDINSGYLHNIKKLFKIKGYCITLDQIENVEGYLRTHFKPNFRTSLRRRLKGLETCFNVSYKMFYGQIDREEYHMLMNKLQSKLIRRFNQRNDKHMSLAKWDEYYANIFGLINEKKASLYVIYDDLKPIQISLNYHYDKILFLSIPSYDIDYSKFGLGNISVQKLLEWCIANDYKMLDMGFGAFDYKVKWCNDVYDFEHHIFHKKSSLVSSTLVFLITLKTKLINYLLENKINIHYHRIKSFLFGKKKSDLLEFETEQADYDLTQPHRYKSINPFADDNYLFLRRAIYDFLYTNLEHISKIEVYEMERDKSYFIKGEKNLQKIIYKI